MTQIPIFSVIIPHKNTQDLLIRCLNSIPKRDDIQIIVIDDNSNEAAVDFDKLSNLKDKNIEIYLTKEGKGAGYARNIGLKHAKGKWVLFADADDFFVKNAFDHLFYQADSVEDIIFFKSTSYDSDTGVSANRADYNNKIIDDFNNKKKNAEDYIRYYWNSPWARMIKTELINRENILFDEVRFYNDIKFSCLVGHYASSIKGVDEVVYTVTASKGSLMHIYNFEADKNRYTVLLERNAFLRKIGRKEIQTSTFSRLIQCLIQYGPLSFFDLIRMHCNYRDNPFVNLSVSQHIHDMISFFRRSKKYISKYYKGET